MTYSKEQYDSDLAEVQEIVSRVISTGITEPTTRDALYLYLDILRARLENFNSYNTPPEERPYTVRVHNVYEPKGCFS